MLHDISKDDQFRSLPRPNANDLIQNRLAHGTTQNHQAGEEISPDGLKFRERQILAQQDGDNKAVFGFLESTNSFGLKVAKPGYDVLTTGDSNLIFNSEQNVFKIVTKHTITTHALNQANPGAGLFDSSTISDIWAHGLSYTPAFLAYMEDSGIYRSLPFNVNYSTGTNKAYWQTVRVNVDSTYVYVNTYTMVYNDTLSMGPYNIIVYLLQETAN